MRLFSKTLLILALLVSMVACGAGSEKWKEEVQLSDGRVIVIERELVLEGGGDEWASNRSGSKPKEDRMRFTHPDHPGEMIEWRTMKLDSQFWPEVPLILDMENHALILYTTHLGGCKRYFKYRYERARWTEEQLPARFDAKKTNLFLFRSRDYKEFINLAAKQKNLNDDRSWHLSHVGPTNPFCGPRPRESSRKSSMGKWGQTPFSLFNSAQFGQNAQPFNASTSWQTDLVKLG